MRWRKLGLIFCPDNKYEWMVSHAGNPVAEGLDGNNIRVYFNCRDNESRGHIGFVEFDIRNPTKILRISENPVVQPGELGTFDDSGVSTGCINRVGSKRYLYYLGWNLAITVPWRNSIGLAISESLGSEFRGFSKAPIVDRNGVDPFSLSYPWVMQDGPVWKMWYGSNLSWGSEKRDMGHVIKYAQSNDGIHWERQGIIAVGFNNPVEYAISRPCVIKENGLYKMWYSYRGQSYRIGYAESKDGVSWDRRDDCVGIDVSKVGWDSETIEYAYVFDHKGERYMFYNGNGYGRTGFGYAVLER